MSGRSYGDRPQLSLLFLPECDRGGTLQIEVPHSYTGQCPPQPEV
ncbi:hypothetical protein QM565_18270 [Geitlerinema splendidum]|nr:hypothetical protein [Geitlerinema splendidum]